MSWNIIQHFIIFYICLIYFTHKFIKMSGEKSLFVTFVLNVVSISMDRVHNLFLAIFVILSGILEVSNAFRQLYANHLKYSSRLLVLPHAQWRISNAVIVFDHYSQYLVYTNATFKHCLFLFLYRMTCAISLFQCCLIPSQFRYKYKYSDIRCCVSASAASENDNYPKYFTSQQHTRLLESCDL